MEALIPKSINPNIFKQIIALPPGHLIELIQTVGMAAIYNKYLALSQIDRTAIACLMMNYGTTILEQCGSNVETTITNDKLWEHPVTYKTNGANFDDILRKMREPE